MKGSKGFIEALKADPNLIWNLWTPCVVVLGAILSRNLVIWVRPFNHSG